MVARRNLLALSKIEAFKDYLQRTGWTLETVKGTYEILRARKPARKEPLLVFVRDSVKTHVSLLDKDVPIVWAFLNSEKGVLRNENLHSR